jgi:excisionase family DNA binding protein
VANATTVQIQLTVTLDENTVKSLADVLAQAIEQAMQTMAADDLKKMPRLRASMTAIFGNEKSPEDLNLLVDTKQAAKLLRVSERTLWKMHHEGEMPEAIRIGRAVRWSIEALRKWVDAGCPHQGQKDREGS